MIGKKNIKTGRKLLEILLIIFLLVVSCPVSSWAGPNAGAGCAIDLDYTTSQIESSKIIENGDQFWVAITALNVSNLDTYQVEVNFDNTRLSFLQGAEENPFGGVTNILKKNGGQTVGFQAVLSSPGVINISNAMTGSDPNLAPEGEGVLGLLKFQVNSAANTSLTLSNVSYLDSSLTEDTPSQIQDAQLVVEGVSPPVINFFTVSPGTIQEGGSALLSWSITGADSAAIDNGVGNANPAGGNVSVTTTSTKTYTLTATNTGGNTTATVTLQVTPVVAKPVINFFTVSPGTIQQGGSALLSWSITGANSAAIDNGVGNANPAGGSISVSPSSTKTYTLTATNTGGNTTATVTLQVNPVAAKPVINSFTVSPGSIQQGSSALLSWSITGADSASIDNGVGNANPAGGSVSVSPSSTKTYTLTATNANGNTTATVTLQVIPVAAKPVIHFFTVSPGTIQQGNSALLSWSITGADSAAINNGVGNVNLTSGSVSVSPSSTTTYTLITANAGGDTTASVTLQVNPLAAKPVIQYFTVSPASIQQGNSAMMSWSITGADSATVDKGVGQVNAQGGSITVNPTTTTTYILTATNTAGNTTATAALTVTPPPQKPVINSFSVSPASIQEGTSATISWNITGANSASIDNGIGNVNAVNGSISVSPNSDTVYTLTATNTAGASLATASLTVVPPGGGPNADAGCAIDLDYTTLALESTKNIQANEEFWIAIVARDVTNLDTYQVEVNFDDSSLSFLQGVEENTFDGVGNILKKNGGQTIGFQAVLSSSGVVNISNALVGNDPAAAPDGDGVLGLLKFKVISAAGTALTLSNVSYIDSAFIEDTPGQISNAALTVQNPQVPVIGFFTAAPASIQQGNSAVLSWSITGATSAAIDNNIGGVNAAGGSVSVSPATSKTYTLTASNPAGNVSASVTINVSPPMQNPVITSFTVNPVSIRQGAFAVLSWNISGADSASIDNGVGGVNTAGGSFTVYPVSDTVYTLTAANANGSVLATASIEVIPSDTDGPNANARCAIDLDYTTPEIEAAKTIQQDDVFWLAVIARDVVNLDTYQVEISYDAGRLSFLQGAEDNPVGGVSNILKKNGGQTLGFQAVATSPGVVNIANSLVGTDPSAAPDGEGVLGLLKFKVLDASSATNLTFQNVTYVDSFAVADTPSHLSGAVLSPFQIQTPVIQLFSATPSSIIEGDTAALSWSITGADSAVIDNGVGEINPAGGTFQVSPQTDTVYTLTASHGSGGQAAANVSVTVTPILAKPAIEYFTASPETISEGEQTLLSWSVTGANSISIDNGIGSVNSGSGFFQASPSQDTTYTMTATNSAGTVTASVSVVVKSATGGGPNAQAGCVIDLDYTTADVIESTKTIQNGETFWIAITARDVVNLDTYQVEIDFDPDRLEFQQGVEENTFDSVTNILKKNGGSTIGFQAVETARGKVNAANALVGTDPAVAPEGDGVLALLQFTVLNASSATPMLLFSVSFLDSEGVQDSPANISGAVLNVASASSPVINSFSANPSTIVRGQGTVLSWSISNSTSAMIDNGIGFVNSANGSVTVYPTQNLAYTLTASNATGAVSASASVTVTDPPQGPNADAQCAIDLDYKTGPIESSKTIQQGDQIWFAIVALDVSNLDTYQVEVNFDSSQLSFDAGYEGNPIEGVANILKKNGGSTVGFQAVETGPGIVNIANALAGNDPAVAPEGDGILALLKFTVTNAVSDTELTLSNVHYMDTDGANDSPVHIHNASLLLPVVSAPSIISFTVNPASITLGGSALLSWQITGADSASMDNAIGTVNHINGTLEVFPTESAVYNLLAANSFGTSTASASLEVLPVILEPTVLFFKAIPGSIHKGQSATLSWSVTEADLVTIDNGVGVVDVQGGSIDLSPEQDTTYKLTASNTAGSVTSFVTVQVLPPIEPPKINSFEVVPSVMESGESAGLAWDITGADTAAIYEGIGPVNPKSGQYQVSPVSNTTYTLIATNSAGNVSAQATVMILSPITSAIVEEGLGQGTVIEITKGAFSDKPTSSDAPVNWSSYFPYGFFEINIADIPAGSEVAFILNVPNDIPDTNAQFITYSNYNLEILDTCYGLDDGDSKFIIVVTDGGNGDSDQLADGKIFITGGPAIDTGFGPNFNAACALDMYYPTLGYSENSVSIQNIEWSSCGTMNDTIWFFVVALNAKNLDTYQVQVNFDPQRLAFIEGYEDNAFEEQSNFLKKNGGRPLGFQAKETAPGKVNISNTLIGNSTKEAPDGSGILALLSFEVLDDDLANTITLSDVYYIDTYGSIKNPALADTITRLYHGEVNPIQIFVAETLPDCLEVTDCYLGCYDFFRDGIDSATIANTKVYVLPGNFHEPLIIDRNMVTVIIRHGLVVIE